MFVETIANPRTQVSDLDGIGALCRERGVVYVVDNTITSPYLFQPLDVDASLIVNSLTKYIGGHGNALGGAVTETGRYDWTTFENIYDAYKLGDARKWAITQIRKKGLRDFGATLGAEAAHHLGVGAETLALRQERQCANAQALVGVLADAPQSAAASTIPACRAIPNTSRPTRCFVIPAPCSVSSWQMAWTPLRSSIACGWSSSPATWATTARWRFPWRRRSTTRWAPERRASMGIADSLIRISTGIEDVEDLLADFEQALA